MGKSFLAPCRDDRVAKDLGTIRAALGDDQLTLGYSAARISSRARNFRSGCGQWRLLDGAVDPNADPIGRSCARPELPGRVPALQLAADCARARAAGRPNRRGLPQHGRSVGRPGQPDQQAGAHEGSARAEIAWRRHRGAPLWRCTHQSVATLDRQAVGAGRRARGDTLLAHSRWRMPRDSHGRWQFGDAGGAINCVGPRLPIATQVHRRRPPRRNTPFAGKFTGDAPARSGRCRWPHAVSALWWYPHDPGDAVQGRTWRTNAFVADLRRAQLTVVFQGDSCIDST